MSHPRYDFSGHVRTDDSGTVRGLFYAVPLSAMVWAAILYWLFIAR